MTPEIDIGPPGCHPERSEGSLIAGPRRLFAALRMTERPVCELACYFCSVHVKYGIDPDIFNALGNINDGTNLVGQSTDDW